MINPTYLASVGVLGGGDLAVAGELHAGEVHRHGGHLVDVELLGGGEAQDVEGLIKCAKGLGGS